MGKGMSFGGFVGTVLAVVVGCGATFELVKHFNKGDSSESDTFIESEVESETSSDVEEIVCAEHIDEDENGYCDVCSEITDFQTFVSSTNNYDLVSIEVGELAVGNVYRVYNNLPAQDENDIFSTIGVVHFSDGLSLNLYPPDTGIYLNGNTNFIFTYEKTNLGTDDLGAYVDYYILTDIVLTNVFDSSTLYFAEGITVTDVYLNGIAAYKLVPKSAAE